MAAGGGSGILKPPGDGDDVAPVIPLRQRHNNGNDPAERKTLPSERAPFDPNSNQTESASGGPPIVA
jgi:hypothetical protein